MILNLGQVCSTATTFAGRTDWTPSEASLYANLALEQVVNLPGAHHGPREAIAISSTTSGGNRIAVPSDFESALALTLYAGSTSTATTSRTTDEYPLVPRDGAWADAQTDQFGGGIPEAYIPYNGWIELYPSPNSSYSLQLRYVATQPTLVNSTDTPDLHARFHQAWVYKTWELVELSRSNPAGAAIARNTFQDYVSRLDNDKALRQRDRRGMNLRFGSRNKAD